MAPAKPARNTAIDAYRGFVMLLMMAEVLRLSHVAEAHPANALLAALAWNQSHVAWAGCSLHDTIQPGFSFLVGAALPYSIGARIARGETLRSTFPHAFRRSLLLVCLGLFLRSIDKPITYFTFEDTLSQIGLGYPLLFLLGWADEKWQYRALGAILIAYWAAWALYPIDPASAPFTGFAAHWNKHANLGNAFDQWFLNLFPRAKPFVNNGGGYLTLSFIPTLATMIFGLIAGRWSRANAPARRFLYSAAACIALGAILHYSGINPIVKRIWTPAWALFSGGVCFLFLIAFTYLQKGTFVLLVIGANSIAAYLMAHLFERFLFSSIHTHLGRWGDPWEGALVLAVFWLMLWWMYRRKIFVRV